MLGDNNVKNSVDNLYKLQFDLREHYKILLQHGDNRSDRTEGHYKPKTMKSEKRQGANKKAELKERGVEKQNRQRQSWAGWMQEANTGRKESGKPAPV